MELTTRRKVKTGMGDRMFYLISGLILTVIFLLILYPCIFVVSASFSSGTAVQSGKVVLWPVDISFVGYDTVFHNVNIWKGFMNSLFYTFFGTIINVALTMLAAYPLSRKDLVGRDKLMLFFTFTMFFNGGIITNYILVSKLGIIDTRWSMLLPGAMSIYNMIIARTFLQNSIPNELLEAAQLDGCTDIQYLFKVVLPLSKAVLAVLVLFYGVAHWNTYFHAMIYLRNRDLFPLTLFLKEILISGQIDPSTVSDPELAEKVSQLAGVIKYSLIVVSMVPVMIIYPFVQKYFVKGVTIGASQGLNPMADLQYLNFTISERKYQHGRNIQLETSTRTISSGYAETFKDPLFRRESGSSFRWIRSRIWHEDRRNGRCHEASVGPDPILG